jgi:hypothetical protein
MKHKSYPEVIYYLGIIVLIFGRGGVVDKKVVWLTLNVVKTG